MVMLDDREPTLRKNKNMHGASCGTVPRDVNDDNEVKIEMADLLNRERGRDDRIRDIPDHCAGRKPRHGKMPITS